MDFDNQGVAPPSPRRLAEAESSDYRPSLRKQRSSERGRNLLYIRQLLCFRGATTYAVYLWSPIPPSCCPYSLVISALPSRHVYVVVILCTRAGLVVLIWPPGSAGQESTTTPAGGVLPWNTTWNRVGGPG